MIQNFEDFCRELNGCGFSMGGESTWTIMANCLDLVGVYMPLSGDYWAIAMRGGAESLNAAVAAGIMMYELMRGK